MAAARFRRLVLSIGLVGLLAGASGWATPVAASGSYLLPLPGGTHVLVTQGNGGGHTGWEKYAWDFAVFGSGAEFPIVAARSGTVIGLQAGNSQHCLDSSCWTLANYILLDQGDGTAGLYMHLAENSVEVVLGQQVTQGQSLGDADNTGWSTGNHLHFQVEQTPSQKVLDQANGGTAARGWWFTQSVSVSFSDSSVLARNPDGMPTYPDSFPGGYVSSNGGPQAAITPGPTPTHTPGLAPTPTPLATPTPTPTQGPTPTPTPAGPTPPQAGSLPYSADWKSGMNSWVGPSEWKTLNGMLLDDGTGNGSYFHPIYAPVAPGSIADYAVEAQIQVVGGGAGSFGIVVRSDGGSAGYVAGVGSGWNGTSGIGTLDGWWGTNDLSGRLVDGKVFNPGNDWHTYRVEVKANVITLYVDGALLAQVTDNKYLNGGQVGLWSCRYQLEVRSFTVTAI